MNAGRLLRETGYDTPALREWLAPVDPDDINVWPAATTFMSVWQKGVSGVTHWKWIFVDPEVLKGDRRRLALLVVHELVHVRQFVQTGYVAFIGRYLFEYLAGILAGKGLRQAYLDIGAEVEARDIASRSQSVM